MISFSHLLHPLSRPLRNAFAVVVLLLAAACSKPEPADVVEIVGAASSCTGCRVEFGPPLELRSEKVGETVFAMSPTAVTIDGQGRFWVAEMNQLARVFDPNGKFLKTVGRRGGGVDEVGTPAAFLPLPGDSMLVFAFDSAQGNRALVVDSLFRVVRTLHLPGVLVPASAEGWPERVLLSGPVRGDSSGGFALHMVSATQSELRVIKSFGPGRLPIGQAPTMSSYQRVAAAKDSGYWSADILRYRISHFAKDGTLIGTIERTPEWFAVPSANNLGTPTSPPPPAIFAIWQAPDGLLWVFGHVAGKNWKEGWPKLPAGSTQVDMSQLRLDKLHGTMVEVLDPITRTVVSKATLDEYISNVLPNGNVAVFAVDSAGVRHLSIRRLSLAR